MADFETEFQQLCERFPNLKDRKALMSELRQYVELLAGLQRKPEGWHSTPAKLLLERGVSKRPTTDTFKGRRGTKRRCYMNAFRLASARPELAYVEGYVTVYGVPIEHAWCEHRETGEVIDPTLRAPHKMVGEYLGVVIPHFEALTLERGVYGVMWAPEYGAQLFTTPWPTTSEQEN